MKLWTSLFFSSNSALTKTSLETAHGLYEASLQQKTQNPRQSHASLQTKLNEAVVNIRLYEKGLRLLTADVQPQLVKYLLRSLGVDVCNDIFFYVAADLNFADLALKPEQRSKIAQDCGKSSPHFHAFPLKSISFEQTSTSTSNVNFCFSGIL